MTKLFYCKSCEAEGDDISPYSRTANAKAVVTVSAYIHEDSVNADTPEEWLGADELMEDSFTCRECDEPVQLVDIQCPHDWRLVPGVVKRRCEMCGIVQSGKAVFDGEGVG